MITRDTETSQIHREFRELKTSRGIGVSDIQVLKMKGKVFERVSVELQVGAVIENQHFKISQRRCEGGEVNVALVWPFELIVAQIQVDQLRGKLGEVEFSSEGAVAEAEVPNVVWNGRSIKGSLAKTVVGVDDDC